MVNAATALAFLLFGRSLLADLSHPARFAFILARLLLIILAWLFAVVRDAESLAEKLGEPLGTLVLTLSVSGTEVVIIIATMSTRHGGPTLARVAMSAVIMIVLNGMVGMTLLTGGLRYKEQEQPPGRQFLPGPHSAAGRNRAGSTQLHDPPCQTFSPIQAALLIATLVLAPSSLGQCARHWLTTCNGPFTSCRGQRSPRSG